MSEILLCTVILSQLALLLALLFDVIRIPFRSPVIIFLGGLGLGYARNALHTVTFEEQVLSLKVITLFICFMFFAGVIERVNHNMNKVQDWRELVSELESILKYQREDEKKIARQESLLQKLDAVQLHRQKRLQTSIVNRSIVK
ncbi:hypothetical protein ACLB2K_034438 [Fragaria x ananassa]